MLELEQDCQVQKRIQSIAIIIDWLDSLSVA